MKKTEKKWDWTDSAPPGHVKLSSLKDTVFRLGVFRIFLEPGDNTQESIEARWNGPGDIKARYPSADIIPGNRIVFNIKGNAYRLIVKIPYNTGIVFIRFVGTHAQYNRIDAATI